MDIAVNYQISVMHFAYLNGGDATVAKGCNPFTTNMVTAW